jgi:hypothetical protein
MARESEATSRGPHHSPQLGEDRILAVPQAAVTAVAGPDRAVRIGHTTQVLPTYYNLREQMLSSPHPFS